MPSPEIKIALMCTGQGSIGGPDFWDKLGQSPVARRIFEMTDEVVGFPLSKLVAEGPMDALIQTVHAQPAIAAFGLAALAVTKEFHPEIDNLIVASCGHSAGELTALVMAGVLDEYEVMKLIHHRGLIMQEFGGRGAMAALPVDAEQARRLCKGTGAEAVNLNGPRQTIISGEADQVDAVIRMARAERISSRLLNVSHAFHHSVLMREAQERFKEVLDATEFRDPVVPIISNVTGESSWSGKEIKDKLAIQIASPVQWHKSMLYLLDQGVNTFVEFGPQDILTKLLKSINSEARGVWIGDYESARNLSL